MLANTVPYMPEGVHLGVVDPGVREHRRGVVLRDRSGRVYVGPDNGLLVPAANAGGGVAEAYELANREYALPWVSRTFHGRDVFRPPPPHLARAWSWPSSGRPFPRTPSCGSTCRDRRSARAGSPRRSSTWTRSGTSS